MRYGFLFALFKRSHDHLRGFLIAAWAGDKIAEFSFPEILFHFPLRPWFFFVSPAYAGKSACAGGMCRPLWDHPRVYGEKRRLTQCASFAEGSPPRMRGKEKYGIGMTLPSRITPAYAGKRHWWTPPARAFRDHPRVCGEKRKFILRTFSKLGSPPRMRGKDVHRLASKVSDGITPAYAGKSSVLFWCTRFGEDHPRVCGEKFTSRTPISSLCGSPPRMRGKAGYPGRCRNGR